MATNPQAQINPESAHPRSWRWRTPGRRWTARTRWRWTAGARPSAGRTWGRLQREAEWADVTQRVPNPHITCQHCNLADLDCWFWRMVSNVLANGARCQTASLCSGAWRSLRAGRSVHTLGLTHFTAGDRRTESHIAGVAAEGHVADGDQQERCHRCTAGGAPFANTPAGTSMHTDRCTVR